MSEKVKDDLEIEASKIKTKYQVELEHEHKTNKRDFEVKSLKFNGIEENNFKMCQEIEREIKQTNAQAEEEIKLEN